MGDYMNDEVTEKPKPKVKVIALRKFWDEKGTKIEAGQSVRITKGLAKKLQDNGVIKVAL